MSLSSFSSFYLGLSRENLILMHANTKGAKQTAHLLVSAFVNCSLEIIIVKLAKCKISIVIILSG